MKAKDLIKKLKAVDSDTEVYIKFYCSNQFYAYGNTGDNPDELVSMCMQENWIDTSTNDFIIDISDVQ